MTFLLAVLLASNTASARPIQNRPIVEPAEAPPDGPALWRDMAQWYLDNGMASEALSMVARLREAGNDDDVLDLIQARALAATGLPEEALSLLDQVVARSPKLAAAWSVRGVVEADLQHLPEAISALERAISLGADDAGTHNNLGFLLLSAERCADAIPHLEAALATDGTRARTRNNLALALACDGQAQRALALFRSTGTEADARYNLGVAFERQGKLPSALAQYDAALSANPDHRLAQAALDRLQSSESETSP